MTISNMKNTLRAYAALLRSIKLPEDYPPVWAIVALTSYYFGLWRITGIISGTVAQESRTLLKQEGIILGFFIVLVEVLNQITYRLGQKDHALAVRLKAVLFWCVFTAGAGAYVYLATNVERKTPWAWNQSLGQTLFQIFFCLFMTIYSLCPNYRFVLLHGSFTTTRNQLEALKDDDKRVRLEAALFFFLKRGKKVTQALIELLDDKEEEIRLAAILDLSARGQKIIVDELEARLNNEDEQLRREALMGIYWSRSRRKSEALFNALQNRHEDVRNAAALLLGQTGDERAIEPLRKLLEHSADDSVKKVASEVLAALNAD